MSEDPKQDVGANSDEFHKAAVNYSGGVITLWLLSGCAYNLFTGNLFSLATILLFIPGVFVISFASIPLFMLGRWKRNKISEMQDEETLMLMATGGRTRGSRHIPMMLLLTAVTLSDWLFPIVGSVLSMWLLQSLT